MSAEARTALVMGASGFLGSHVVRQLVARGDRVRAWTRASSSTAAFEDLDVEHVTGELSDGAALLEAMRGVDAVHYCIVDTRAWVRDAATLFATNVAGLRHALDAAVAAEVPSFVFCSTVGTIALCEEGLANEEMPHNWAHLGGAYIQSRLEAENLVLRYHRERGLPAVVLNVAMTYGPRDHGPTPHGRFVRAAARGKVPAYVSGVAMEVVGIEDAARAFLLAAERGRPGERYIVSESFMPIREVLELAARTVGAAPPRVGIPLFVLEAAGLVGDLLGRLGRIDLIVTSTSVRLMHCMTALDHGKATRELGWEPSPTEDSIRAAALFFTTPRT